MDFLSRMAEQIRNISQSSDVLQAEDFTATRDGPKLPLLAEDALRRLEAAGTSQRRCEAPRPRRRGLRGTPLWRVAVACRRNKNSERHPPTGRIEHPESPPPIRGPLRTGSPGCRGSGVPGSAH